MICLKTFAMPSKESDEKFFESPKARRSGIVSYYPFALFRDRELPRPFVFRDISIFSGDNGSGKSTILNVIAERLGLRRDSLYNRTEFFEDYTLLCEFQLEKRIPPNSRIITSDDVFDKMLDRRRFNRGVDDRREYLLEEWLKAQNCDADTNLHGMEDFVRWRQVTEARSRNISQSSFLRSRLARNSVERSNGESALDIFVDSITDGGLYLLDEPENSLSPKNQIQLKFFIEDCVKYHECQFIISTHSPFLLSLRGAVIYDIDRVPAGVCKSWTELENIKTYYEFFKEHAFEFEHGDE